jgi:23S rRNA (uracil1939-C5)-methyltransferase
LKTDFIEDLKINKLVYQGFGLGFHDSNPIFVYNAVPGDIVRARVLYRKKKALFAEIDEVLTPGESRIEPACEVFGKCGGCDWLNISYRSQLNFKEAIIREIFRSYPDECFLPIAGSDVFNHYRNKSFMPVSLGDRLPVFGIYAKRSHSIVPHRSCRLHPAIFDILSREIMIHIKRANVKVYNELNKHGNLKHIGFRYSFKTDEVLVVIVTRTSKLAFTKQLIDLLLKCYPDIAGIVQNINPEPVNRILGVKTKLLYGKEWLEDSIGDIRFRINYNSFFQINPFTMRKLYDHVKSAIVQDSQVLDTYSGIGSIALYVADKAKKVIAVEDNENAVKDGIFNATLNKIKNVEFRAGRVEDNIKELCSSEPIDTIIFDPPRKGLEKSIIEVVSNHQINRIIYVSCNPSTQVRDVELLKERGYKVVSLKPFDMFPHTYHIENVAVLEYDK